MGCRPGSFCAADRVAYGHAANERCGLRVQPRRVGVRRGERPRRAPILRANYQASKAFTGRSDHPTGCRAGVGGFAGRALRSTRRPHYLTRPTAGERSRLGSYWLVYNSAVVCWSFTRTLGFPGNFLYRAPKKLCRAECLFGFSQHKMRVCDLRLRNCQTSIVRSWRLVNCINLSRGPARGLTPV
jgi:hypothetical protein